MSGELLAAIVGAVLGAALSLGSVLLTSGLNGRAARRQQRAEWVQELYENKLLLVFSRLGNSLPSSSEMQAYGDLIPRVPYALDVVHRGRIGAMAYRLRHVLGHIYSARTGRAAGGSPPPSNWLDYEEEIEAALDDWVRTGRDPNKLFRGVYSRTEY